MIQQEYEKTYITAAAPTTTLVFTGRGILHSIVINKTTAAGVITMYDAITATNTFGIITQPATLLANGPMTILYDVVIKTGLTIVTSGAGQDILVTWQH
jgi:hypothetical protein